MVNWSSDEMSAALDAAEAIDPAASNVYLEAKRFQDEHPGVDVFPCDDQKQPMRGVFWQRSRDIDDYDWDGVPAYGVVPYGYTVLDFDSKESLDGFVKEYGKFETTLAIQSPRGVHFWFEGETEHANAVREKMDLRSGGKGYIIGPGSRSVHGEYKVLRDAEVAPVSERLSNVLTRGAQKPRVESAASGSSFQEVANAEGYNNALLSLKGKLVKLGVDEHIANEMVRSANSQLEDPLDAKRLETTVLARKHYTPGEFQNEIERPVGGRLTTSKERRNRPPIRWLVDDVFPDHGVAQIVAPSMAGKSFAMIDLCLSIVNHSVDQWCGRPLTSHGSVVYVLSEGSLGFQRRIDAWTEAHPGTHDDNLWDLNAEEYSVDLASGQGVFDLTQDIVEAEIDDLRLIVIDTQGQLLHLDENSNSEWNQAVTKIKRLAKAHNCLVVFVHHSGNDRDTPRARGASAMLQSMDSAVSLKRTPGGVGTLKITKVKEAEHGYSGNYELVESGESVYFQWLGGDLAEAANNDRENMDVVISAGKDQEASTIIDLLDQGLSIRNVARHLSIPHSRVQRTKKAHEERLLREE